MKKRLHIKKIKELHEEWLNQTGYYEKRRIK
mgnify:CR=1 FL=1